MRPQIETYPTREAMAAEVAGLLARRLRSLIDTQGYARIALAGGSTPAQMLTLLGQKQLDWRAVTVTLTDERWVAPTDTRSNQRMLGETLLASGANPNVIPLYADAPNPETGLADVIDGLAPILPLDIAVLGMGADMHTASLFPGAEELAAALAHDAPPAVALRPSGDLEPRITLTASTLNAAERHLYIAGLEKKEALDRALDLDDRMQAPVLAILDGATVHHAG
ncbi:MAG: 6-phosphogluconolactonase [Pseudomonadota bacterium]